MVKFSPNGRMLNSVLFDSAIEGDDLLLVQDAVLYAVTKQDLMDELKGRGVNVYACKDDLIARGYNPDNVSVNVVDYEGIVDLIEKNPKIIS
jgi:tRNA 2-thiouridine synthesizing protein B